MVWISVLASGSTKTSSLPASVLTSSVSRVGSALWMRVITDGPTITGLAVLGPDLGLVAARGAADLDDVGRRVAAAAERPEVDVDVVDVGALEVVDQDLVVGAQRLAR